MKSKWLSKILNTALEFFLVGILILIIICIWIISTKSQVVSVVHATGDYKVNFLFPELKTICAAESTGDWTAEPRHWDSNGDVLRGRVNSKDIGQCQINEPVWGDKAKELGLDIYSFNGNRRMANWIYERYGNQPWYLSEFMWNKPYVP